MPSLSETIAGLAARRTGQGGAGHLTELADFGSNPGALRAWLHVPDALPPHAPLVVVLHGCTQTAAGYDVGSGWSQLADRHGFALLFPEQKRRNNPNLCFNWFSPDDTRRGRGEALSIRQMIEAMVAAHDIDPARIFVTGLSAGGAMTSVMLATYPEIFAGGAIIAGLPYGCATSISQALDRMRGHGLPGEAALADLVRQASDHPGPWPTVSVWHGDGDATVSPVNADAVIAQWRSLHDVAALPDRIGTIDGARHRVWLDRSGRAVIEEYRIAGMGHGTPLATSGPDGCGTAGPHMIEAGISSTRRICAFWGLAEAQPRATVHETRPATIAKRLERMPAPPAFDAEPVAIAGAAKVGKIIEDALRAAGLMR